jgi:hypothetical protein
VIPSLRGPHRVSRPRHASRKPTAPRQPAKGWDAILSVWVTAANGTAAFQIRLRAEPAMLCEVSPEPGIANI